MDVLLIVQLLALLVVANGTPVIVEKFLGKFLAFPIDGGATFADGKPVFGSSKTLRGWSNPISVVLANGEYTMTVRLSPDQWTNVEGERSGAGFAKTLKRVDNIGLTFGGGCFFGHGVSVTGGTARFLLTRFDLKP